MAKKGGHWGDKGTKGNYKYVSSRLLDGTAGLLDGVIINFSKDIKRSDHLVVIEGIRRSVAKHEDAPEHGGRGTADGCLNGILDHLFVRSFVFKGVVALANNLNDVTAVRSGSLHHHRYLQLSHRSHHRGRAKHSAGPHRPQTPRGV